MGFLPGPTVPSFPGSLPAGFEGVTGVTPTRCLGNSCCPEGISSQPPESPAFPKVKPTKGVSPGDTRKKPVQPQQLVCVRTFRLEGNGLLEALTSSAQLGGWCRLPPCSGCCWCLQSTDTIHPHMPVLAFSHMCICVHTHTHMYEIHVHTDPHTGILHNPCMHTCMHTLACTLPFHTVSRMSRGSLPSVLSPRGCHTLHSHGVPAPPHEPEPETVLSVL